ncbi:MAG: ribosomal protein L7Ae/L30e/S12e/Gadd45 [Peptococcaceae bacterium]|jgi:ribosomal protein L7Ae-like RNA K-turn-binding protein|nr:ribosomal protein L7Ae/L30e/S12e/Gadd45 [Peptococcaceae bacterium]
MTILASIQTLLGFAKKAGKLVSGESAVEAMLKRGIVTLVILAEDLPEKRKSYWLRRCDHLNVDSLTLGTKDELGRALGLSPRSILAVTDTQMAQAIKLKGKQIT